MVYSCVIYMDILNPRVVRPMMQAPTLNQLRIAREIVQASEGQEPAAAEGSSIKVEPFDTEPQSACEGRPRVV